MTGKYDDIINMPHHVSKKHPHMSNYDRAAQFSPFAALTGHDAAVKETARITDIRIELDESEKTVLDEKLQQAGAALKQDGAILPRLEITYFVEDLLKDGGSYEVKKGLLKKLDTYRKVLVFEDLSEICIDDIIKIEII